jgi:tagatose 1,6-diphosphate aldolase GatY/KbaY
MSRATAKDLLVKATMGKYAVGAFNATSLVQIEAIVEVAAKRRSPVIIQTSVTPAKFLGPKVIVSVYRALADSVAVPICLHLDHCQDVSFCKVCIDAGYTSVMIDASREVFGENVHRTREVSDYAHKAEFVSVEGELGTVHGVEDQIVISDKAAELANPDLVTQYVQETCVDAFAPAIGTAHGVYKTPNPFVDFGRFEKIWRILNGTAISTPLVVHGGTGLPPETVRKLVSLGGAKFNVSTDLKHALIDATYKYISANRDEYDPGKIDKEVKNAVMSRVDYWMDLLGCSNRA